MAILNKPKHKWDLYKHNLKELFCGEEFGTPVFSGSHIRNIQAKDDTTLYLDLVENFYYDTSLKINGGLLMDNGIKHLHLESNKECIILEMNGEKMVKDLTITTNNRLNIYINAYTEGLHVKSNKISVVGNVFSIGFSKESLEEKPEDPFHFIFRSLQGQCSGIYVRWPYRKEHK